VCSLSTMPIQSRKRARPPIRFHNGCAGRSFAERNVQTDRLAALSL
jgi:hypothetical protein